MRHKWTERDHLVALYLTKAHGSRGWRSDPVAVELLHISGISAGSLQMAISNFLSLFNLGGLQNTSKAQREVFIKYGALETVALRVIASESLRLEAADLSGRSAVVTPATSASKIARAVARKYECPAFLLSKLTHEAYVRWLHRKALAHAKRDKKRGNNAVTNEAYKIAIHRAVVESRGFDAYTGEFLSWELVSKYDNSASKAGRREYKAKFVLLPTVDHVGDGRGAADFKICAWRTNDAKSDMSLEEFVGLCRKVVKAQMSKSH